MQRFVFYANSDWTDTQLNELKPFELFPPARFDGSGNQFTFVHVFMAEDFDVARLQISRLRFGPDGAKAGDHDHAKAMLRKMPAHAPEGSPNWLAAMDIVTEAYCEARSRR